MARISPRFLRRILLGSLIAVGLATGATYTLLTSRWAADRVRARMIEFLEARFDADVALGDVMVSLVPRLAIDGRDLRMARRDGTQAPFIRLAEFHIAGNPLDLLRRRVGRVTVDGFELTIQRGARRATPQPRRVRDVRVGEIVVRDGMLRILPRDVRKPPLEFELQEVMLTDFGFDRSSAYRAQLINPKPRGHIRSQGRLGPWDTRELGDTAVAGTYDFADADLSTIKGIAGTLQSTGSFTGVLERIEVRGTTHTPDFALSLARQPLALDTVFRAVVDGTSGDTQLEEVDATLGTTRILSAGSVRGTPGAKGRTITLNVRVTRGRFEDFLRLTVKGAQPPMRGAITLQSAFDLPPGDADVPRRLRLAGTFQIERGRFTRDTVQRKVDALSRRGRGEPANESVAGVTANFGGRMTLGQGVLRLPEFRFAVRGALVDLGGAYHLHSEALDFTGALILDAPISKTTTGWKSLALKAVDPLFRKDGAGAVVPIRISGTVDEPAFGLDVRKVLRRPAR